MSFLDRFKRKGQDAPEPEVRPNPTPVKPCAAPQPAPPEAAGAAKPAPAPTGRGETANKLAAATVAAGYSPEFKAPLKTGKPAALAKESSPGPPAKPEAELVLELGDFLHRIPQQRLQPGPHDVHAEVRFGVTELADRIARGQTTIPLSELYKRLPEIFRESAPPEDSGEIRFPWQKVVKLLADAGSPTPGLGLNSAAAEALAEKLKNRRAVRNIIPSHVPADKKPKPASAAAPAQPASAPPAAAPTPPAAPVGQELEFPFAAAPEDDDKLTRQELVRARDSARLHAARVKGEYERQIAAVSLEKKLLAEQRDKIAEELARASQELHDKLDQVEFEKSVTAKSTENAAKLQQERDALQRELQAQRRELEALKSEGRNAEDAAAASKQIEQLTAERDAFARQLAEIARKTAQKADSSAAVGAQAQRQIEELQRRIVAFESGQRDSAQELQRERDARIKLERQLTAADRFKQETAVHVDESQAALRREFEAAARKRDADAARALKEAQEQVEAANAARDRLGKELDETRSRLAASAAAPAPVADAGFEERIVAQFEADIESYRARIKALLQERDTLASEKEKLNADLASRSKVAGGKPSAKNKDQQSELEKVAAERDKLARRLGEIESAPASDDAAASAGALAKAHEEFQSQLGALREQIGALTRERDEARIASEAAITELRAQKEAPAAAVTGDPGVEIARLTRELENARASSNSTITKLRAEAKKLTLERQVALKEGEKLLAEIDEIKEQHQKALEDERAAWQKEREEQTAAFQQQMDLHISDRDTLAAKARSLNEQLDKARAELEAHLAKSKAATSGLEEKLKAAEAESTSLSEKAESLKGKIGSLENELSATRQERDKALADVKTTREKLAADSKTLNEQLTATRADRGHLAAQLQTAKLDLERALAAAEQDRAAFEARISDLTRELDATREQHQSAQRAHETERQQLAGERDRLQTRLAEVTRQLEIATHEHGAAFRELEAEHQALRSLRDALDAELSAAKSTHEQTTSELKRTIDEVAAARAAAEQRLATTEQRLADAERAADDRLAGIQSLESAVDEARAVAERHAQTAAQLTTEHRQALDVLASKRDRALAEKDAALAALAADKAALLLSTDDRLTELTARHEAELAALANEKAREIAALEQRLNDELAAANSERERLGAALESADEKIVSLMTQLEKSERESAAVAQQLALNGVDADKRLAALTAEFDQLRSEHQALAAEFEEARESHKAQSGVFSREFKAAVRQRDDALAQIEAERQKYEEKAAELARQSAALTKREEELGVRFERDLARARRERDSVVEQRDALRARIEQLIDEQRKMLAEVAQQAMRTGRHGERPSVEPPPAKTTRESRSRRDKETNVIDITTAEIVPAEPEPEPEHRLNIPRIRPVAIPPPQVRVL